ncbi:MAG: c-type cytochrome [Rhodoferax sp.]|nr:c-type cytochrome [Rhodoferax sp.]
MVITMATFSVSALKLPLMRLNQSRGGLLRGAAFASALLLAGCAVETVDWQNRQAAQEVARLSKAPGSVYLGWRVFQDRCAGCHGEVATGTAGAPDLLPRVREMGAHQFVSLVLQRYDWNLPVAQARSQGPAREALIEEMVQRKEKYMLTMPAWQGEPVVNAHIADLYAYLSARAQGTQGPARPAQ